MVKTSLLHTMSPSVRLPDFSIIAFVADSAAKQFSLNRGIMSNGSALLTSTSGCLIIFLAEMYLTKVIRRLP